MHTITHNKNRTKAMTMNIKIEVSMGGQDTARQQRRQANTDTDPLPNLPYLERDLIGFDHNLPSTKTRPKQR